MPSTTRLAWVPAIFVVLLVPSFARQASPTDTRSERNVPSVHVQSSLVLVDVITQDAKTGLPVRDLKREDFRIFNDRGEVSIESFDAASHYQTRPIVVWLTVLVAGILPGRKHGFGQPSNNWTRPTPSELYSGAITAKSAST